MEQLRQNEKHSIIWKRPHRPLEVMEVGIRQQPPTPFSPHWHATPLVAEPATNEGKTRREKRKGTEHLIRILNKSWVVWKTLR